MYKEKFGQSTVLSGLLFCDQSHYIEVAQVVVEQYTIDCEYLTNSKSIAKS